MPEKMLLDRALYKRIKSMNKDEMSKFIEKIYRMGVEDSTIDIEKVKSEISEIKGIGESRLNQIMEIIINNILG